MHKRSSGGQLPVLSDIPDAPSYMGKIAKAEWKRYGQYLCEQGMLTFIDLMALEVLVNQYEAYRIALQEGATHNQICRLVQSLNVALSAFAATPTGRGRVGLNVKGGQSRSLSDMVDDDNDS